MRQHWEAQNIWGQEWRHGVTAFQELELRAGANGAIWRRDATCLVRYPGGGLVNIRSRTGAAGLTAQLVFVARVARQKRVEAACLKPRSGEII